MTERELFHEALLRTDPADRATFLDGACAGDAGLRNRVEALLDHHARGNPLLDHRPIELLDALAATTNGQEGGADARPAASQLAPFLAASTRPGALGRLGHYDVLEVLGQGGFGIVVKAFDTSLHRVVAIKVLAPHVAATSPPRQRFLREARATAQVKHEHVVQIYAVEERPLPYLVMEFVEGQTLQQRLDATGPLGAAEVVRLGQQIALGLAAAHDKGLIHRDVKPANVLLEAGLETRAKLTDFGLARAGDDASLTQSGVIAGTPMFMSPEQACGGELDHRADLFSLGSVLYTMVTGRPPFRAPSTLAILKRVADDTPRPIRQVLADVPPGLCDVIMRLLEKQPANRFATARETAEALAACLTAPLPRARRRTARRLAWAGVAVLLLAAVGLWGIPWAASWMGRRHETLGPTKPPTSAFPPNAIVVTSTRDDDTPGTLRWAVNEASVRRGEDTIVFDPTVFAGLQTITLTRGQLTFLDSAKTTVLGPAGGLTIDGDEKTRVFEVGGGENQPAAARLIDLTIARGRNVPDKGDQLGGGFRNREGSTLELVGCTLRDNTAEDGGGGMNFGTLTVINCTFTRNEGRGEGGGLKNYGKGAKVTVTNCTFVGNNSRGCGGLLNHGGGRCEVYNSLFAQSLGGCIVQVRDSGEITGAFNLMDDTSGDGSWGKTEPNLRLGPLGRYGGPTETFPLLTGSPAIDAGDTDRVPAGLRTDQRGRPRVHNGKVDVGAFEAQ